MAKVTRVRSNGSRELINPAHIGRPYRPGDRMVTWLVTAFAGIAIFVFGFALVRSHTSKTLESQSNTLVVPAESSKGFRVVRIIDGDTIIIIGQDNIELTVRMAQIDAPEKRQACGDNATKFLQDLICNRNVYLDNIRREKFGRILADVYLDTQRVDLEIIKHGWAWVYPKSNSHILKEAEITAKQQKLGLWATESPTPPWEWRNEEK